MNNKKKKELSKIIEKVLLLQKIGFELRSYFGIMLNLNH